MVWRTIRNRDKAYPNTERVSFAPLTSTVNTSARFALGSTGWTQASIADAGSLQFQIPSLPVYARLLTARFKIRPVIHVSLPATKPQFQVIRSLNGGNIQLGATIVDPSATVAEYNAPHIVTVPNLNFALSPSAYDFILVVINGETGANSILGMSLPYVEFLFE